MLLTLALALGTRPVQAVPQDYRESYIAWVRVYQGHCYFWMTDVGLDGEQLTETLSRGYDPELGLEVLTTARTPNRCVKAAKEAALKAGFRLVRSRRGTDRDRLARLP
jgi:hypothetical protein